MEYSPYLQALQRIRGSTRGAKCETLTTIAKKRIRENNNELITIETNLSRQLPEELLVLWVKLNVSRLLLQPHAIVAGLLSDDQKIFLLALKAKQFFKKVGTTGFPDVQYFKNYIFPNISLPHRNLLIKTLAIYLTDPKIAKLFYKTTTRLYGFDQARPFLKKCNVSFIRSCIDNYQVRLTLNEIKYLYSKNPSFIIDYLYLQDDDDFIYESSSTSNIRYTSETKLMLRKFLPQLLKNHSTDFCKLIQKYSDLRILLTSSKTMLFLKKQRHVFLNNPHLYLPMLSLKKITSFLPRNQFKTFFQKFFPLDPLDFKFMDVYILLEFMPQTEKLPLILETFKDTYFYELTDYQHCVISAIKYFPLEERHNQARRLILNGDDWMTKIEPDLDNWRCYLPLNESHPMIKADLEKCQIHHEKVYFSEQLIYSCEMNENFEAMLDTLEYIHIHCPNMKDWEWVQIFDQMTREFDFKPYILLHWIRLYDLIFNKNIRTGTYDSVENIWNIVCWGIQEDLKSKQYDINEKILVLTEINEMNRIKPIWNICKDNVSFERTCLQKFMDTICSIYVKHQRLNTELWKNVIVSLVSAMYDFNNRHKSFFNHLFRSFSVKNYGWLNDDIENLLDDYFNKMDDFDCRELIILLKDNEPEILKKFLELDNPCDIRHGISILKKDISRILCDWQRYYKACKENITTKLSRRFLEHIKWSQHLSRRFVEECLRELKYKFDKRIIKMLAILLEGSALENNINTFMKDLPAKTVQEIFNSHPDIIRLYYPIFRKSSEAIKYINTPFPLMSIKELYRPEFMPIIAEYLTGLEKQVPVNILVDFFKSFLPMPDSIVKHVVRICEKAASTDDLQYLLIDLWRNPNNDVETRTYLLKKIHHTFTTRPTKSTWKMMKQCLNDLNYNDQTETFDIIACYRKVNKRYLTKYIKKILSVFTNIEIQSSVREIPPVWCYIPSLIDSFSIEITMRFPEKLHQLILRHWLTNVNVDPRVIKSSMNYFINCYIIPARNDLLINRLQFFSEIFKIMLGYYLRNPKKHNKTLNYIFINSFFREFINNVIFEMPLCETKKLLVNSALESFSNVLEPLHDIEFYCYLQLTSLLNEDIPPRRLADKIDRILLIQNFSIAILCEFSQYLCYLMKFINYDDNSMYDIIDRLMEHEKKTNTFLATCMVLQMIPPNQENDERYQRIMTYHNDMCMTANEFLAAYRRSM